MIRTIVCSASAEVRTDGARIWTGQAVLAHNLVKIGTPAG